MSIRLPKTVRIGTDSTHDNDVFHIDDCSNDTENSIKMPWLCMLCKLCDVRVCIALMILAALAFVAIVITILILMH